VALSAASPAEATPSAAALTASEKAAASGEAVEDTAQRTEYSQTFANPDGTFTLTQSTTPQRARDADGTWRDIDATLERRADGSVRPKSTVVDLEFAGGGDGDDMIRLGRDGRSFTLGWPGRLPEPTLEAATATYAEVLPGVDLQLTATAEGYRQVLVVKSSEAAGSDELERLSFAAAGDGLEVVPGAGGGLRAVDEDGNAVFNGPAGQMWDSAGDQDAGTQTQLLRTAGAEEGPEAESAKQEPAQPGAGDASAVLPVQVAAGTVTVNPDLDLLRGSATVYPVYIDPPVGLGRSERTKISSDGDRFWQFNGDLGVGRCGNADGYYCGDNYIDRMLFEFGPGKLSGKYVLDATFRAYETWSFNCDAKWLNLVRTNNISEGTRWPGPSTIDHMGDRLVSAGRGDNCSPDQPDKWIEFNDDPAQPEENLTSTVRAFADGKFSRLTLMLWAKDENDPRAWKRFDDNAELQVTYVPRPGVPTDVGLIPGDGKTAYCEKASTKPLIVTRLDPMVQARVQTKVQPGSGEEKGSLQAEFIVENRHSDGVWGTAWSGAQPGSGWHPDGTLEKMRTNDRGDGGVYRYRARTQSHWAYGGKSGDLHSSYSSWCYFNVDASAPKVPQIINNGPYQECTDNDCPGLGGPGTPGSFTFKPNAADKDVTSFKWRLIAGSTGRVNDASGASPTVSVVPQLGGTQVLSVWGIDVRGRGGTPAEFIFKVAPPEAESGRWHFDDATREAGTRTAQDTATVGTRHPATLTNAGVGWSTMARRGDADQSLWLNDTSNAAQQTGYAATSSPAVITKDSFTVSAWAYLTDATETRVVLSQSSATLGQALSLSYSPGDQRWGFSRSATDANSPAWIRSPADQPASLNVWTHLAGVFQTGGDTDPKNDTVQLFVNGRPQGQPINLYAKSSAYQPWAASGGLNIGRSPGGQYFRGRVDEVAVWQYALTPADIAGEARALDAADVPMNELVAQWDATSATGSEITERTAYPRPAMKLSASGAVLNEESNALTLDGATGYASAAGPVIDESGSFTVSASVQLDAGKLAAKPVGYRGQVAGQRIGGESSWALWVTKPGDGVYQWKFTRTAVGSDGKVTQSAEVPATDIAETDTWVQLTGVFDAQATLDPDDLQHGRLQLYVGQDEQGDSDAVGFTAVQQGSGELAMGRGAVGGSTGNHLLGNLGDLRIWTGAMNREQIRSQVLAEPDTT
jgi:hypothetical protein